MRFRLGLSKLFPRWRGGPTLTSSSWSAIQFPNQTLQVARGSSPITATFWRPSQLPRVKLFLPSIARYHTAQDTSDRAYRDLSNTLSGLIAKSRTGTQKDRIQLAQFLETQILGTENIPSGSLKETSQSYEMCLLEFGKCLRDGIGVSVDKEGAASLFHQAAKAGSAEAQFLLADCLHRTLSEDSQEMEGSNEETEAVRTEEISYYLSLAAKQGHAEAAYRLGNMLVDLHLKQRAAQSARGFNKAATDSTHLSYAIGWFKMAGEKQHPRATYQLGICWESGWGVPEDRDRALEMFKLAAQLELHKLSAETLLLCSSLHLSKDDRDHMVLEKELKWLQKNATGRHKGAQFLLAELKATGDKGVPQSFTEAIELMAPLAEQGFTEAQYRLALTLQQQQLQQQEQKQLELNKQSQKAIYWFEKAAAQGHTLSQYHLAKIYLEGGGRLPLALSLMETAAEKGHAPSMHALAETYRNQREVKDETKSWLWLWEATRALHPVSMYECALYLLRHSPAGQRYIPTGGMPSELTHLVAAEDAHESLPVQLLIAATNLRHLPSLVRLMSIDKKWQLRPSIRQRIADLTAEEMKEIADLYLDGHLGRPHEVEYFRWLTRAAMSGHDLSQLALGKLYWYGWAGGLVSEDRPRALEWFGKAKQSCSQALFYIGQAVQKGVVSEPDIDGAVDWFRQGAALGDVECSAALGQLLLFATNDCHQEGLERLTFAANNNHAEAQWHLSQFLLRNGPERITEALHWTVGAADNGNVDAIHQLATWHMQDEADSPLPAPNKQLGLELFHRAALLDHAPSQLDLGRYYYQGSGVPKDEAAGLEWIRRAADQLDLNAMFFLALLTQTSDPESAADLFLSAARGGHPAAQLRLGYCYILGQGLPEDLVEGVKWVRRSAKANHVLAQHYLGVCLLHGDGMERNVEEAVHWFTLAAKQGHQRSIEEIQKLNRRK